MRLVSVQSLYLPFPINPVFCLSAFGLAYVTQLYGQLFLFDVFLESLEFELTLFCQLLKNLLLN